MASMTVSQQNKVILDFMKGVHAGLKVELDNFAPEVLENNGLYDCSWDWLMPVVNEINQISIADLDHVQGSAKIKIKYSLYCMGETVGTATFDLKHIWGTVVDFCKAIK